MARFEDKDTGYEEALKALADIKAGKADLWTGYTIPAVAVYAAVNEFGSKKNNIPERPFMRSTIDANQKKYASQYEDILGEILDGESPRKALVVANEMRNDIVTAIIQWKDPANKESTVEQKGANNPLVDTGQMQRTLRIYIGPREPRARNAQGKFV